MVLKENWMKHQKKEKKIEVDIKNLENETAQANDKIVKYKQQQMDSETNEQYRAFVKEIRC